MSKIDEVVPAKLLAIARKNALVSTERHDYLPTSVTDACKFTPHAWVESAMRHAYHLGKSHGRQLAMAEVRRAIGLN